MTKVKTIEQLLKNLPDSNLLDMLEELHNGTVPATSYTHSFIRNINNAIDKGELCINPSSYRRVYLPTLTRYIYREASRRYMLYLTGQQAPETSCEQIALGLVDDDKQADKEDAYK